MAGLMNGEALRVTIVTKKQIKLQKKGIGGMVQFQV